MQIEEIPQVKTILTDKINSAGAWMQQHFPSPLWQGAQAVPAPHQCCLEKHQSILRPSCCTKSNSSKGSQAMEIQKWFATQTL